MAARQVTVALRFRRWVRWARWPLAAIAVAIPDSQPCLARILARWGVKLDAGAR